MWPWFLDYITHPFSDLKTRGRGFWTARARFVHYSNLPAARSAVTSMTGRQKSSLLLSILLLTEILLIDWFRTLRVLIMFAMVFYFLDLLFNLFLTFRSFIRNPEINITKTEFSDLAKDDLPIYTILCPLYKEVEVLPQFVDAITALDYPKDKLEVLLLLEEDDTQTKQQLTRMNLPSFFKTVVVPNSKPKTKPKAMNYGLAFAHGKYIAVYDAEDVPDTMQLKKVLAAFKQLPEKVACIQGKLNFYNSRQNTLTRLFAAEYSLWFDLILPGLQSVGAPIPLGGTSNHFKATVLKSLGGWDAFNVTEDCDLGMRLAKAGYLTAIVDSTTLEEANSNYGNWHRQRSRWIKGYMQTYLVHMRCLLKSSKNGGWKKILFMQLTIGGKILSLFINPLLWILTIIYFAFRSQVAPALEPLFPPVVLHMGVVSLIFGNFFYTYIYLVGLAKRREFRLMQTIFLVPLYWLAMSLAAWKALYELLTKPHYWQKTIHGLHLTKTNKTTRKMSLKQTPSTAFLPN